MTFEEVRQIIKEAFAAKGLTVAVSSGDDGEVILEITDANGNDAIEDI